MRAKTSLNPAIKMVQYGYGWVEGNKLSARHNGKIFAQLPAASNIEIIENGRFLKYDYANGVCNLTGPGEWLLAFNEVKVYEDRETDADFAMIKDNYQALVYNAVGGGAKYAHYMPGTGTNANGERELTEFDNSASADPTTSTNGGMMPPGTTMVPRLFKTDLGDIMTLNTIKDAYDDVNEGDMLKVDTDGYLTLGTPAAGEMGWQIVKKYNMPDLQPGVKIMRVQ